MTCRQLHSDTDTAGQLNILENMLVKDYAAIAVSPLTGDCLISGIVKANQDEVPIITTGNEVDADALKEAGGSLTGMITVDFKSQGEMGAQYIIDNNKSDSKKVAVIAGNEGGTQADARRDGAKEAFEAAGYDVVAVEHVISTYRKHMMQLQLLSKQWIWRIVVVSMAVLVLVFQVRHERSGYGS